MKVIITGATGMVGEGVLFECLRNGKVTHVLSISRKPYELQHPKLKQLIVKDFTQMDEHADELKGYDACFFCAGISSVGMKEDEFRRITYTTTLAFAQALLKSNDNISFCYVSGAGTDTSEKGRLMWARVKGKTENDLASLPFRSEYNFRPGVMQPFPEQKNWKPLFKAMVRVIKFFAPGSVLSLQTVGLAMINCVSKGYDKNVLEVKDIKKAAAM